MIFESNEDEEYEEDEEAILGGRDEILKSSQRPDMAHEIAHWCKIHITKEIIPFAADLMQDVEAVGDFDADLASRHAEVLARLDVIRQHLEGVYPTLQQLLQNLTTPAHHRGRCNFSAARRVSNCTVCAHRSFQMSFSSLIQRWIFVPYASTNVLHWTLGDDFIQNVGAHDLKNYIHRDHQCDSRHLSRRGDYWPQDRLGPPVQTEDVSG